MRVGHRRFDNISYTLTIDPKEITIIIKEFIHTYINNAQADGIVLGLSGGVDSAVTAVLCTESLGAKHVLCLFMPDESTPKLDWEHQQLLVDKFSLNKIEIDISLIIRRICNTCIENPLKQYTANVKARIRMTLLYYYAHLYQRLVCGSSNKSELLTGYFTKYGDGGADIQPIADLYKTQVKQLAQYLHIPKPIITKAPTAGLWPGQTDEMELGMTYDILDQVLYGLEIKDSPDKIAQEAQISNDEVLRIRDLRIKSQHKRRLPLIPKIGTRTAGFDWRAPVQEG